MAENEDRTGRWDEIEGYDTFVHGWFKAMLDHYVEEHPSSDLRENSSGQDLKDRVNELRQYIISYKGTMDIAWLRNFHETMWRHVFVGIDYDAELKTWAYNTSPEIEAENIHRCERVLAICGLMADCLTSCRLCDCIPGIYFMLNEQGMARAHREHGADDGHGRMTHLVEYLEILVESRSQGQKTLDRHFGIEFVIRGED